MFTRDLTVFAFSFSSDDEDLEQHFEWAETFMGQVTSRHDMAAKIVNNESYNIADHDAFLVESDLVGPMAPTATKAKTKLIKHLLEQTHRDYKLPSGSTADFSE